MDEVSTAANLGPEWISAIANCVAAVAIVLAFIHLKIAISHFKAEHERSRRQLAVSLMEIWVRNLTQHATAARKLVDNFSDQQAKSLFKQEPLTVPAKDVPLLNAALKENVPTDKDHVLTVEQSSELRWEVVTYLNALEVILSAWNHGIADKAMLEEQFRYLVSPQTGSFFLVNFRIAAGGAHSFPNVETFVQHLVKIGSPKTSGKPEIG